MGSSSPDVCSRRCCRRTGSRGHTTSVQDEVVNDGAQHHFLVSADFGAFPATGTSMLRTRVIESEAIAALKDARQSEVFVDALKFQVLHPLRG